MSSNALWGKVPDAPDDEVEQDIAAAIAEVRADKTEEKDVRNSLARTVKR